MDTNTNTKRGRGRPVKADKLTSAQRQQQYRERQSNFQPAPENNLLAAAIAERLDVEGPAPILLALISIAELVCIPGKTRSVGIERARALLAQYPADPADSSN